MTGDEPSFPQVAVIIPALNEAANLRVLVPRLMRYQPGQIIVADNGSTDETAEVVGAMGVTLTGELKRGYGAAAYAGMQQLAPAIEVVAFVAANLSDDTGYLPALVQPIIRGERDLVISVRFAALRQRGAMTLPQRLGSRLAVWLIRIGWGYVYHDLGPFRAIRRTSLEQIGMQDRAFGWTVEMQIRAVEENLRILELPVPYRRRAGRSKISGTAKGVYLAAYSILGTCWRLWRTREARTG